MASMAKSSLMAALLLLLLLALAFVDGATAEAREGHRKLLGRPISENEIHRHTGTLEVHLIEGKDLKYTDVVGNMQTYVLVHYGTQQQTSKVVQAKAGNAVWNETFKFNFESPAGQKDLQKITFKIMDKDTFSKDDLVGEAVIYAKDIVSLGLEKGKADQIPTRYRVVLANQNYYGQIKAALTFIRKP